MEKKYLIDNNELMKEWNYEKNKEIDINSLTIGCGKKVWWKCSNGHEWEDSINHRNAGRNCPYCSNHRVLVGYNDLFTTHPDLKYEWDYDKNREFNPNQITSGSHKKVWWKCSKNHSYESVIKERVKGRGCPYCANKKILIGYNDLFTTHSYLSHEWNYKKNNKISPNDFTYGSNTKVWWKCEKGHEYLCAISHKIRGNGCPYCANKKILVGYNDLATLKPELLIEWNYKKNSKTPQEYFSSTNQKVWWKCSKCGQEWETTINARSKGSSCPYCAHQKLIVGKNDLLTVNPYLASQWHPTKNGSLTAKDVFSSSGQKVWWLGECGHEWQAPIVNRNNGTSCPICAKSMKISFPEKCIYFYIKKYFVDVLENAHLDFLDKLEFDIYIPSLKVGIEYDGSHWHNDLEKDLKKDYLCKDNGHILYRIREKDCERFNNTNWIYLKNNSKEELEKAIKTLLMKLSLDKINYDIDIKRDRLKIYELMNLSIKEKSLLNLFPELALQWHTKKNGDLKPSQFSAFSDKCVWWLGECGHEWESSINSRTNGNNCPYCSNQRLLTGYNDLATTHPHLLKEWDYAKNKEILPNQIFAGSEVLVWWKCSKGHEWETLAYKRKNGEKCPYCSNKRVLKGYNDLATTHPDLIKEWDCDKNIDLTPYEVVAGSNKKAWWKCSKCGYEWNAVIAARSKGAGCKKCFGTEIGKKISVRKLKENGSLYENYPELMREWDYEKNTEINPKNITSHFHKKVWWKCSKCYYEWHAYISNRVREHGCPVCAKIRVQQLKRQTELEKRGSLLKNSPELAKEWDYERNGTLLPEQIFSNSSSKVWWICPKGHSYEATPNNRARGRNCPYCSNHKILAGYNDLATTNPELVKEWNYDKNIPITPNNVSSGSDKVVWWKCGKCNIEWQASIYNRNKGYKGCPNCLKK